ncbi:MAG: Ser-Thr-rich GPI-anchored membrane family protein [Armatimonadota bacterium]|nr:Ser-Thr-rich GPI-anchored membrane family protein [Armatimonadota bacterium]
MKPLKSFSMLQLSSRITILALFLFTSTTTLAQTTTLGDAVDNISLTWTTGGDANWFGQTSVYYYDGDAAQSGDMPSGTGRSSWIRTTVVGPGILSFYWRVSALSAANELAFYLDGTKTLSCWAYNNWEMQTYSISTGSHTLEWNYAPVIHSSGDAGFLDKVVFTSGPAIVVQSPNGGETWYHRNYYNIKWTSTEDTGSDVKLELYKGASLHYTISNSTDNDGNYSWFVPVWLEPGADYRIKIISVSNPAIYAYSADYFSISSWYQSSFGGLLMLDGVDDYAMTEDHDELDIGDEAGESFTLEAWFYMRASSSSFADKQHILDKSSSYDLYAVRYYDYGTSRYYGCIGFSWVLHSGQLGSVEHCRQPAYSLGWHHIALVFYSASSEARFYLDGQAFGNLFSVGSAIKNSTQGLKVGSNLDGTVDESRISDVARYAGETYDVPTSPFTCDEHTRALWHFDEFEGATIFHDECGVNSSLGGYNGAHTEGIPAHKVYLPLVIK